MFGAAGHSEQFNIEGNGLNACENNTDDESDSVWEDIEEQSEKKQYGVSQEIQQRI